MVEPIRSFFRELAETHPKWNFIYLYDPVQADRVVEGFWMTLQLSLSCVVLSVVIGVAGAWLQGSHFKVVRAVMQGYIQFFRNTPPLIQLLFFYFALGQFTPTYSPDGWLEVPVVSNVGWAIISLSFFAGAFNVEIFRAGIEAVPDSTKEAAEALGMSRLQIYAYVVFPLAFRVSLPALNNNLVNLVKTTTQAIVIAVPELPLPAREHLQRLLDLPERLHGADVPRLHPARRHPGHRHEPVGTRVAHAGLRELSDGRAHPRTRRRRPHRPARAAAVHTARAGP